MIKAANFYLQVENQAQERLKIQRSSFNTWLLLPGMEVMGLPLTNLQS